MNFCILKYAKMIINCIFICAINTESESLAKVTALFHDGKSVDSITAGQSAVVILENTPFYAESGGQIGDSGYLTSQGIQFNVKDTQKYGQVFDHIGELKQGIRLHHVDFPS